MLDLTTPSPIPTPPSLPSNLSLSKTHKTGHNLKQLKLLRTLYYFRFGTAELISGHVGVSRRSIHNSLLVLVDKGLLHRRYEPGYKLIHKPAVYCLAPAGIRALRSCWERDGHELDDQILQQLHNTYSDRMATEKFVTHSMNVMQTVIHIKQQQPKTFDAKTTSLMTDRGDEYPRPKPDLYLKRRKLSQTKPNEYFVDTFEEDVELWIIKKRVRLYILHQQAYEWSADEYPTIVLIVKDKKKIPRLRRYIRKRIEEQWLEEDVNFIIYSEARL